MQTQKQATLEDLKTIFPWYESLLGVKGTSMSQAQKDKDDFKNKVVTLTTPLNYKSSMIYDMEEVYYSTEISTREVKAFGTPTKESFDVLEDVANMNSKSAILGAGVKLKDKLLKSIENIDYKDLFPHLGLSEPVMPLRPIMKEAIKGTSLDRFTDLNRAEDMIEFMSNDLFNIVKDVIIPLLEAESKAAVYGNQVSTKECFLRKLNNAELSFEKSVTDNRNQLFTLVVKKEDFKDIDADLSNKHNEYQNKKNGYMKLIKDSARKLDIQYKGEYQKEAQAYNTAVDAYRAVEKSNLDTCIKFASELTQLVADLKVKS